MKRAAVYKLGPMWSIAQKDGKFWVAGIEHGCHQHSTRFPTHAEALAHALHEVGLSTPPEHREAP